MFRSILFFSFSPLIFNFFSLLRMCIMCTQQTSHLNLFNYAEMIYRKQKMQRAKESTMVDKQKKNKNFRFLACTPYLFVPVFFAHIYSICLKFFFCSFIFHLSLSMMISEYSFKFSSARLVSSLSAPISSHRMIYTYTVWCVLYSTCYSGFYNLLNFRFVLFVCVENWLVLNQSHTKHEHQQKDTPKNNYLWW